MHKSFCPKSKISIHAAREGGDRQDSVFLRLHCISIHAAREGGDPCIHDIISVFFTISIHAAREGGDPVVVCAYASVEYFNPRRP